MQKLPFTSPSGLGEFQINEPTRPQMRQIGAAFRAQWRSQTAENGLAIADIILSVSRVDVSGIESEFDILNLCDEIGNYYVELDLGNSKKKPPSGSGSGAENLEP